MEQKPIFKATAFGGFEKHSVLNYIDEISAKSAEMEKSLNQKIEEFSSANSQLGKQVEMFEKKISSLEDQLKSEQEKIHQLTGEVDKLNLDVLEQRQIGASLDKELRIKTEQHIILTEKLRSVESKAEKFEETAIDLGSLFIDAQQSAQKIVGKAMDKAETIKSTTLQNVENISGKLDGFKKDIDHLRENISTVVDSISSRLNEIVASVDEMDQKCKNIADAFRQDQMISEEVTLDEQK